MKLTRSTLFLSAAALLLAAGMARRPRYRAQRILRISRVVSDLGRAEAFYRDGLGFQAIARGRPGKAALAALGLGDADAEEVVMRLGTQDIALVRFTVPGRPYPRDSRSDDLWFQHLAIVVDDMDVAYARLCAHGEWRPISEAGPQLLPPSNGAVRAFKFRDPDGHPLELIWFPPGQGRAVWHEDACRWAVPRHRPQRALRRFHATQPAILSRAGPAGQQPVAQSRPRPGPAGRAARCPGAGHRRAPGFGLRGTGAGTPRLPSAGPAGPDDPSK